MPNDEWRIDLKKDCDYSRYDTLVLMFIWFLRELSKLYLLLLFWWFFGVFLLVLKEASPVCGLSFFCTIYALLVNTWCFGEIATTFESYSFVAKKETRSFERA
jgi:hypothetical protein